MAPGFLVGIVTGKMTGVIGGSGNEYAVYKEKLLYSEDGEVKELIGSSQSILLL